MKSISLLTAFATFCSCITPLSQCMFKSKFNIKIGKNLSYHLDGKGNSYAAQKIGSAYYMIGSNRRKSIGIKTKNNFLACPISSSIGKKRSKKVKYNYMVPSAKYFHPTKALPCMPKIKKRKKYNCKNFCFNNYMQKNNSNNNPDDEPIGIATLIVISIIMIAVFISILADGK